MERHFKENLELARGAQQSLGLKMAAYINGPNLDNTGKVFKQQVKPSFGGGREPTLVSNYSAPSTGVDDRDQAAARSAMRGLDISKTVNLNLPGSDNHITGGVGGKARSVNVNDWKDPGIDPTPQRGTAITKLTKLAVPIARPIRAENADGVTSFHFSYEPISMTRRECQSDTGHKTRQGSARDHADYIEREGALARHYVSDNFDVDAVEKIETDLVKTASGKTEALDPVGEKQTLADVAVQLGEAAFGGAYIERQEAVARETDGGAVLYTNIDADPAERHKFWELVEIHEREPGEDYMRIREGNNFQLWNAVFRDPDCPRYDIKPTRKGDPGNEVRIQTESNDLMRALMLRHGWTPPKRCKVEGLTQDEQAAVEFQQDEADGIVFEDARGGRIQFRIIGELPHEVGHDARVRILRGFAQEFERRDIPYVGVMHEPDHTNSDKNWHFHLIYYDRPVARFVNDPSHPSNAHLAPNPKGAAQTEIMKAEARTVLGTSEFDKFEGQWDFSIPYTRKSASGNTRTRKPFTRPKHRECSKRDFIPKLRNVLADLTNEELESGGHRRRVDPRKHPEFGIDRPPDKHLGTKAAQLETAGISTDVGRQNERNQWVYQMTQIQRHQEAEEQKLRGDIAQMRLVSQASIGEDPHSEVIESHINRYEQIRRAATEHEVIALTMQENIDRAASRAHKVKLTCEKHLKAINEKKATKRQIKHKSDYEKKLKEAINHLDGLKILFASEALQIGRSTEQAKLLQNEAKELHTEYDNLTKQVQADRGIRKMQAMLSQSSTKLARQTAVDGQAGTQDECSGALTKEQIDAFIDTVFKESIRLVTRDDKIVPAIEDPRFAAVVNASNYANFQARLKGIQRKQIEAVTKLLDMLNNNPETIESTIGPDGNAIVTLKINDKPLQAVLRSYRNDPVVSNAINKAIAAQRNTKDFSEDFSNPSVITHAPKTVSAESPKAHPTLNSKTATPAMPLSEARPVAVQKQGLDVATPGVVKDLAWVRREINTGKGVAAFDGNNLLFISLTRNFECEVAILPEQRHLAEEIEARSNEFTKGAEHLCETGQLVMGQNGKLKATVKMRQSVVTYVQHLLDDRELHHRSILLFKLNRAAQNVAFIEEKRRRDEEWDARFNRPRQPQPPVQQRNPEDVVQVDRSKNDLPQRRGPYSGSIDQGRGR